MQANTLARWSMIPILGMISACQGEPFEIQRCPAVSYGTGVLYATGAELVPNAGPVTAEFQTSSITNSTLYGAHPIAIAPSGGVTLTVALDLATHGVPSIYLYGPRNVTGTYGKCVAERSGQSGSPALRYEIAPDSGGEYLLLIGRNPIGLADGSYSVDVTCEGIGCEADTCPITFGQCDSDVCSTGFTKVSQVSESGTVLSCASCGCDELSCGAFQRLVYDQCVCDCDLSEIAAPVCGDDGETYQTSCFAACAGVQVANATGACADVCPDSPSCGLDCESGYLLTGGCPVCECNMDPCQGVSHAVRPVCGTDGLSYTNIDVLECSNVRNGTEVQVAYLGHCLPYCGLPNCELSCEFGVMPSLNPPPDCFECACQAPTETCTGAEPMVCARPRDAVLERLPEPQSQSERLARGRSFMNACVADDMGWRTLALQACPSGVCDDALGCSASEAILRQNIELVAGPIDVDSVSAVCNAGLSGSNGADGFCVATMPLSCSTDSDCLSNQDCVEVGGGKECRFQCQCLNSLAGRIYDPVCAETEDGQTTLFNSCIAYCLSLPPSYPGICCSERLSVSERLENLREVDTYCAELGDGFAARVRIDTACPPSVEECKALAPNISACCQSTTDGGG